MKRATTDQGEKRKEETQVTLRKWLRCCTAKGNMSLINTVETVMAPAGGH